VQLLPCDLGVVCTQAVDELKAAHPERTITCMVEGDLTGRWDAGRLSQLASNLVGNAVQHGDPTSPVAVAAKGNGARVEMTVHNFGPSIAPTEARGIFDPLSRGAAGERDHRSGSLGLGLYIAKQIVEAHGGEITLRSSDAGGTLFAVSLPRQVPKTWPTATRPFP